MTTALVGYSKNMGEIVAEAFECALSLNKLEMLIELFPDNSHAFLTNKMFEDDNFICRLNGEWLFVDVFHNRVGPWSWEMDNKELYKSFNSSEQESYNNGWTYIYEGDDVFPEDAQLLLDSYTQESVEFHLIHPTALVSLNDVSREEVAEIVNMHYSDKTSLINAIVGLMGRAARKN